MTAVAAPTAGRTLLDPELLDTLSARITDEHTAIDRTMAARILDQTAAFLAAAGDHAGEGLSPSALVDIGWHAFVLHTRDYAEFCERVAGGFIHHVPETPTVGALGKAAASRGRTVDAIKAAGFLVDAELWPDAVNCSQCYAGCTDSPVQK